MTGTQRRGRKIMMTTGELDDFLTARRTCRVATVSAEGAPHVSALWFVWDGVSLWLYSVVRSKRWAELRREPRVAVIVDAGEEYEELRGAELSGTVEFVGEIPRTGDLCAELDVPETLFARKYSGLEELTHDGRHAWLRLTPTKVVSWDFRKLGTS
ncbi:pyridoxamine 5'-phosphate oxidase family protein [Streptomyces nodosus]|uniref:Pyridoxamine 5'-phosphate oxidase family protein n=1 Tax=Streptomyces nodosus TaxID=40318 RepID=A0A0B5D874_9ACTN|nr:pyridoxamine 5'-phosphate oxidase family protein [Streptomyces nodosus]AJE39623.1 pyridoxamine 5-phosphate oxidase [Streptomyces nodosus]MBB4790584.1 nitroimidazol reductase NimA-like FMN-containing flavoprotein (pyridoxamine 5'-phosphate oxidase superfamily) [Streptomyces nodosus]QEV38211.1 pyridoxamine 5'-phosphate oxidase family protein [Streptomyces nodosus]